ETQASNHQPNGRYWAAYMYHHYFGNALLPLDNGGMSRDRFAAYASRAGDGSLWLMVVNKDPAADVNVPISFGGVNVAGQAEAYTWSADNYAIDPGSGTPSKDAPPGLKVVGSGNVFGYTFPKYSITAIHLYPH
ncbi:MAG: hypothetical protein JOZ39_11235, partial [Chloroflexi bacterium]|nr:hypothetical protein [Chloroflexota bacterium]